jgi:hypothetical protein
MPGPQRQVRAAQRQQTPGDCATRCGGAGLHSSPTARIRAKRRGIPTVPTAASAAAASVDSCARACYDDGTGPTRPALRETPCPLGLTAVAGDGDASEQGAALVDAQAAAVEREQRRQRVMRRRSTRRRAGSPLPHRLCCSTRESTTNRRTRRCRHCPDPLCHATECVRRSTAHCKNTTQTG